MPHDVHDADSNRLGYVTGLTRLGAGEIDAAIESFRAVLSRDPSHMGARRNLIRGLIAAGEHQAVITETSIALRLAPESAELHFLRGTALNALRRPIEARETLQAAIALNPNHAPSWLNLGNAHADMDDMEAAETHCRRALDLDPVSIEALASLGFILTAQSRPTEAIKVLRGAIRANPDNVHAHWNLATAALLAGDLPLGFAEYEWRKRHDQYRRDFTNLPGPVWDGSDPTGRTILVHAEQGLGDTIQFARYLPLIAARGGTPVLACEPSLIPLLSRIDGARAVSKVDPLPRCDAWIDQMSLPRAFGTALDSIPFSAGYLSADPKLVAAHAAALPPGRRIGLVWAGNPLHRNDRRRTPPETVFRPLIERPDCHFVSLMAGRSLPGVPPPARPLTDYAETAALIAALDLVVTVDTSVAHVAGALGCPAWVMLPHAPDWRWLLNRNDTPWYDSLRLFRQPSPGDWAAVIAEIVAALGA
jgi:tetratricopeptide (TPR) repeat protein